MADTKISALTSKTTLVANDITNVLDSEASNADKKTTLANIKTFTDSDVVKTVNSQTPTAGAVTLDADDIDDTSTTNKFVTAADLTTLSNTSGTNTGDQDLSGLQADVITTRGDVVIGDASGDASRLAIGTNGQVLTSDGTDVSWEDATGGMSNPMTTAGDIIYSSDGSGTPARLAIGTEDQVLSVSAGGVPEWVDAASGGGIGTYNGTESLTVTGTNALGAGIGTATGSKAVGLGNGFNANGDNSVAVGDATADWDDATAIGDLSDAGAIGASAYGKISSVVGDYGTGIGTYSNVEGGADYGTAIGCYARAARHGEFAYAIEKAGLPNRLMSKFGYYTETSDSTQAEMFLNNSSGQRLIFKDTDSVIAFDGVVIAVDYSGNASSRWTIKGLIARHGGTTAFVGTPTVTQDFNDAGLASASVAVEADDTNDALALKVTGIAATTVRWTASFQTVEDIDR